MMNLIKSVRGGIALARSVFLAPSVIGNVEGGAGDTTRRFTAMTYQQTSKSDPYGDLFRLINAHGRAKGGIKAFFTGLSGEVMSSNPQTTTVDSFNLSGKTLKVVVDGGVEQTITFPTGTVSGVTWTAVPNVESVIDTAVHMPVDLTGASQFRLTMVLGSTTPTQAMKFRVLHVATGNMSGATDISANANYAVLGATGSEVTLTPGTGGIYVGPWETIDEAAKTAARALVFSGRNGASAAQNFKNVCVEYR